MVQCTEQDFVEAAYWNGYQYIHRSYDHQPTTYKTIGWREPSKVDKRGHTILRIVAYNEDKSRAVQWEERSYDAHAEVRTGETKAAHIFERVSKDGQVTTAPHEYFAS